MDKSGEDVIPPMPQKPDRSWASLKKKMWEQPLVPVGCLVTVGFLLRGLYAAKNGQKLTASQSMKGRVMAQGFTAIVVVAGIYMQGGDSRAVPKISFGEKLEQAEETKK